MTYLKLYDKGEDRIAFYGERATNDFWDRHWNKYYGMNLAEKIKSYDGDRFILDLIGEYLEDRNAWILEGGCGVAGYVYCMQQQGYNVVGIDYAESQ